RGERRQCGLERRREALRERRLRDLVHSGRLLASPASGLGSEPVERRRARDPEQPGAWAAATWIETVPDTQRLLERLAGEILGENAVAREVDEVAVDVVEVRLRGGGEARSFGGPPPKPRERHGLHASSTPPLVPASPGRSIRK